jgi:hypothetical protein
MVTSRLSATRKFFLRPASPGGKLKEAAYRQKED